VGGEKMGEACLGCELVFADVDDVAEATGDAGDG